MAFEIDERAQHLLKTLIECYVRDGQPVGSRALARDSRLDLSPATIRNVMADLEAMGMVTSPHTSAGRIPTARGYRLFVDSLITMKPLENNEVQRLKGQLEFEHSVDDLLGKASSLLSEVTHMAGLVMIPRRDQLALRHIEFLPMSEGRILAVLVINNNEVQNRIINARRHFTPSELQQAANYLNEKFAGENLLTMRRRMLEEMRETKASLDSLMQAAMKMAEQVFNLAPWSAVTATWARARRPRCAKAAPA
jgi:heat-inducible transcriptional repressor